MHSVIFEHDFIDPWTASDRAFHLSVQVAQDIHQGLPRLNNSCVGQQDHQRAKAVGRKLSRKVTFDPILHISIGFDDEISMLQYTISHASLSNPDKPWSLVPQVCSRRVPVRKNACDLMSVGDTIFAKFLHDSATLLMHQTLSLCHEFRVEKFANHSSWSNDSTKHKNVLPAQFAYQDDHCWSRDFFKFAIEVGWIERDFHDIHVDDPSLRNLGSAFPKFLKVARFDRSRSLHRTFSRQGQLHSKPIVETVPIAHLRRDFESPITWQRGSDNPTDDDDEMDADEPNEHPQPAFNAELANRFARAGFDPDDPDFETTVRTWYIDHATVRRWTAPRVLQLVGPPRGWESQFSSLWVDQIDPDEWFDITIIEPDAPKPRGLRHVMLDLVITQSINLPRMAGLVTVLPSWSQNFELFSVACSFPERVSGYEILQAADAADLCRHKICQITYRWQEVPNTLRPTHEMSYGHGFQLQIHEYGRYGHTAVDQDPAMQPHRPGSSDDSCAARSSVGLQNPSTGSGSASSSNAYNTTRPNASRFMTDLHVFQLAGLESVTQLVNAQIPQPSHALAQALNVPLDCLETVHVIPTTPFGFPQRAIPAIIQRRGDVPMHSTDRLILVDVVYHRPPWPNGDEAAPTVVRAVHCVAQHILRPNILMIAGVFHYCNHWTDMCSVFLDGRAWPPGDHATRPVRHGSYALIEIPVHPATVLDMQHAVQTVQQDGEVQGLPDLFSPHDHEDQEHDHTHLTQLSMVKHEPLRNAQDHLDQPEIIKLFRSDESLTLPIFHDDKVCMTHDGAVLQPLVELNPIFVNASLNSVSQQTQDDTGSPIPRPSQPFQPKQCRTQPPPKTRAGKQKSGKGTTQTGRQSTIADFFHQASEKQPLKANLVGQAQITDFFKLTAPNSDAMKESPQAEMNFGLNNEKREGLPVTEEIFASPSPSCIEAKCSHEQTADPPVFTRSTPPTQQPPAQERPRPLWAIELQSLFDELASVRHQETGPELAIDVWYVHHVHHPVCLAPRLVRIDNLQDLWYADLCTVWFDQISRHLPLKVLIVRPLPPYTLRSEAQVHVILEQGMQPGLVAIHFTAAFHGGSRAGIFQRAESSDDHICTRDMIERHQFASYCEHRPCHMWMGSMRFHFDQREPIFAGISVLLDIHDIAAPSEPASSSRDVDHNMLMQLPPGVSPARPPEMPDASRTYLAADNEARDGSHPSDHAATVPPATAIGTSVIQVRNPAEFTAALQWIVDQQPPLCSPQQRRQNKIVTWFSDAVTLPRSDHFREVLLSPHPLYWTSDILQRWKDWIEPGHPVLLQLVQPSPSGGLSDTAAHVVVIQRQLPDKRTAIITVVELLEDPWHPTSFCTLLPTQVSHQELLDEADVTPRCQPLTEQSLCEVTHGSIKLLPDMTFPVRHGYNFEIALSSLDTEWDDSTNLIQIGFSSISAFISSLDSTVKQATISHMQEDELDRRDHRPISVTITPPIRQGTPSSSFEYLTFHTVLQAAWQPLSLLSANTIDPSVPVLTWYLDFVRHPQCFAAREVQLFSDPEEWTHLMRFAWSEIVLYDLPLYFYLVHPDPIEMEVHAAMHVILVQQAIQGFDAILVNVVDSAWPGMPPARHASMAPHMLPFPTLIGIAYRDQDCNSPHNTCTAWRGDQEINPHEVVPLANGMSLTVAIHRHHQPAPDDLDPWDDTVESQNNFTLHKDANDSWDTWDAMSQHQLCKQLQSAFLTQTDCPPKIDKTVAPVSICLEAALPHLPLPPTQELDPDVSAIAWFQNADWQQYCYEIPATEPFPLPDGLKVPDVSYPALLQPQLETDPQTWTWEVYVDGSQGLVHAGWSVIIVCADQFASCFCGCFAGQVQLSPGHPQWLGANETDNIAAEFTAFAVAQDVVMRLLPQRPAVIRPDLRLSQMIATFESITTASPRIAQVCRVLSKWLGPRVKVRQIAAHQGHPWNELADALAKWATTQSEDVLPQWNVDGLHRLAVSSHDLNWCWLQDSSDRFRACFPPLVQDEVMQFPASDRHVAALPQKPQADLCCANLAFACATTNVLALDHFEHQNEVGRHTGARTARLDIQMHRLGVAVVGIQEARTKPGTYRSEHYSIFASGFQGPRPVCLGCELWIH